MSRLIRLQLAGELTDAELLDRFTRERDAVAFEAIMRRYGPLVLRVGRRVLGREQDAEDVFQATFLVFSRKPTALRDTGSLGAWLSGVAYRIALRAKAMARRRATHEGVAAALAPRMTPAKVTVSDAEVALEEELACLPEKYRAVLVLSYVQGLTRDEMADRLRLTHANIKKRLERGRVLLLERLTKRGVTLSSTLLSVLLAADGLAAVPPTLVTQTMDAAVTPTGSLTSAGVSPTVLSLAEAGLASFSAQLSLAAAVGVIVVAIFSGGLLVLGPLSSRTETEEVASARPQIPTGNFLHVEEPPSTPVGLPLALRLVAARRDYQLDLQGLTQDEYNGRLLKPADRPPPPKVELSLKLTNFGHRDMTVRVSASRDQLDLLGQVIQMQAADVVDAKGLVNQLGLQLRGPSAVTVPAAFPNRESRQRRIISEDVILERGQSMTLLAISSLTSCGKLSSEVQQNKPGIDPQLLSAYWTTPGEYWLSAEYALWVMPAPPGIPVDANGFGLVVVRSPETRLRVDANK